MRAHSTSFLQLRHQRDVCRREPLCAHSTGASSQCALPHRVSRISRVGQMHSHTHTRIGAWHSGGGCEGASTDRLACSPPSVARPLFYPPICMLLYCYTLELSLSPDATTENIPLFSSVVASARACALLCGNERRKRERERECAAGGKGGAVRPRGPAARQSVTGRRAGTTLTGSPVTDAHTYIYIHIIYRERERKSQSRSFFSIHSSHEIFILRTYTFLPKQPEASGSIARAALPAASGASAHTRAHRTERQWIINLFCFFFSYITDYHY